MGLQDFSLDLGESGLDRVNLVQDVDAVAVIRDHLADPAHLSFNPVEPRAEGFVVLLAHRR